MSGRRIIAVIAVGATIWALLPASLAHAGSENCSWLDDVAKPTIAKIEASKVIVVTADASTPVTVRAWVGDGLAFLDCDGDGAKNDLYASGVEAVKIRVDALGVADGFRTTSILEAAPVSVDARGSGWWEATFSFDRSYSSGQWAIDISAIDKAINASYSYDSMVFSVKRSTQAFVTVPLRTRKGETFAAKAKLTQAGPSGTETVTTPDKRISYWFRQAGGNSWVRMGSARTNERGVAIKRFKAQKDGRWQSRYAGDATHTPSKSVADRHNVLG